MVDSVGQAAVANGDVSASLLESGGEHPKALPCEYNLCFILEHDPAFKGRITYDMLSHRVLFDGKMVIDVTMTSIQIWIQEAYGIMAGIDKVHRSIEQVAHSNQVHPVRTYLNSLDWDGEKRIDQWLQTYMGADDTPLYRAYGRRWLLACVWRALRPGCQADSALIIYSPKQGEGKSTALSLLCGRQWFGEESLAIGQAQKVGMTLLGKWIYEIAELSSLRKKEQEEIKHFLTQKLDEFRLPYARANLMVPRSVCFAGTTNSNQVVSDCSGSRRFWVFEAGKNGPIDRAGLVRDRDQLWAEAMHIAECALAGVDWAHEDALVVSEDHFFDVVTTRFVDGGKWWLNDEEDALRKIDVENFSEVDPLYDELLLVLFEMGAKGDGVSHKLLLEKLHLSANGPGARQKSRAISDWMVSLGWTPGRTKIGKTWTPGK